MPIKIEITGDNAKTVMQEMFNLCSGVFATYENPPSAEEVKAAGAAIAEEAKEPAPAPAPAPVSASAPAPQPEAAKAPLPEKKGVPDNPFLVYAKDVIQCISEGQHNEIKFICGKFVAAKPDNRKKLRAWLTEHKVKRLSELPESLYEEFKKWLEANENAG